MQELTEWREARAAFLALSAGSPDTRAALDRLANAEDALFNLNIAGRPPACPKFSIDQKIMYVDRHHRIQTGKVRRVEASWSGWRDPLTIYTVEHPTYRNNRIYITDEDITGPVI